MSPHAHVRASARAGGLPRKGLHAHRWVSVPSGEAWVARRAASWQAMTEQHQQRPRPGPRPTVAHAPSNKSSNLRALLRVSRSASRGSTQVRIAHVPVPPDAQGASDRLIQPRSAGARNTRAATPSTCPCCPAVWLNTRSPLRHQTLSRDGPRPLVCSSPDGSPTPGLSGLERAVQERGAGAGTPL